MIMDSRDFDALEDQARQALRPGAMEFCATGADDEISARENVEAWRGLRLRPHILNDITAVDITTTVIGGKLAMPILVAPMGRHMVYNREGEAATARGAAMAGAGFTLPTNATRTIEDVAKERGGAPQWFQLYMYPDRSITEQLLDRAAEAGYAAIAFTVDQPAPGWSPRASRTGIRPSEGLRHVNLPGQPFGSNGYDLHNRGVVRFPASWTELEWLVKRSPLPIIVKGVLRGDDAARSVDMGAKGILVSNHGGRHLDTTVTTAEALPEVVDAVGQRADVYVDSGIRRGTDVLKAIALGAKAVLIGRPALWGLTVRGAEGVNDVLVHLAGELKLAMINAGVPTLADAKADLVARRWGWTVGGR